MTTSQFVALADVCKWGGFEKIQSGFEKFEPNFSECR
jgi:hypothetical protein